MKCGRARLLRADRHDTPGEDGDWERRITPIPARLAHSDLRWSCERFVEEWSK